MSDPLGGKKPPDGPREKNEKFADYLEAEKFRTESKYVKAIELFQKILEKDPSETGVRMVLGDLLGKAGEPAKALENYYMAASTYLGQGVRAKAEEVLARMGQLDRDGSSLYTKKLRRTLGVKARPAAAWDAPHGAAPPGEEDDGVSISLTAPLFKDLSPQARARLVERMAVLNVRAGSVIYREGDPGTSLYVIASGGVRLLLHAPVRGTGASEERVFEELGPGEFFGEFAFLTGTARQFTARATSDARIFQLPKASLDEVQRISPGIAQTLWHFYKDRVLDRVLAGSALFHCLAPEQRHAMAEKFLLESHPPGAVIIAQDSPGDTLYLIRHGDVRVTATGPSGDEVFLTNLHGNDFFGEFSFLTGRPRSASVVATSDVELLSVSRGTLEPHLRRHPEVLQVMKRAYFERMADNLHKLASSA